MVSNRHRSPHKVKQLDSYTMQDAKQRCSSILRYLNEGDMLRAETEATALTSFIHNLADDNLSWSMRRNIPTFG